jgi:hypothetical protein
MVALHIYPMHKGRRTIIIIPSKKLMPTPAHHRPVVPVRPKE